MGRASRVGVGGEEGQWVAGQGLTTPEAGAKRGVPQPGARCTRLLPLELRRPGGSRHPSALLWESGQGRRAHGKEASRSRKRAKSGSAGTREDTPGQAQGREARRCWPRTVSPHAGMEQVAGDPAAGAGGGAGKGRGRDVMWGLKCQANRNRIRPSLSATSLRGEGNNVCVPRQFLL